MAKIGTLAGYNRVSEVPEDDYLMLENQLVVKKDQSGSHVKWIIG